MLQGVLYLLNLHSMCPVPSCLKLQAGWTACLLLLRCLACKPIAESSAHRQLECNPCKLLRTYPDASAAFTESGTRGSADSTVLARLDVTGTLGIFEATLKSCVLQTKLQWRPRSLPNCINLQQSSLDAAALYCARAVYTSQASSCTGTMSCVSWYDFSG